MFGAFPAHPISSFRASGRPASFTAVSGIAILAAREQPILPLAASSGRPSSGPTWSATSAHGRNCWKAVGEWQSSGSARCEQNSHTSPLARSTTGSAGESENSRRARSRLDGGRVQGQSGFRHGRGECRTRERDACAPGGCERATTRRMCTPVESETKTQIGYSPSQAVRRNVAEAVEEGEGNLPVDMWITLPRPARDARGTRPWPTLGAGRRMTHANAAAPRT